MRRRTDRLLKSYSEEFFFLARISSVNDDGTVISVGMVIGMDMMRMIVVGMKVRMSVIGMVVGTLIRSVRVRGQSQVRNHSFLC